MCVYQRAVSVERSSIGLVREGSRALGDFVGAERVVMAVGVDWRWLLRCKLGEVSRASSRPTSDGNLVCDDPDETDDGQHLNLDIDHLRSWRLFLILWYLEHDVVAGHFRAHSYGTTIYCRSAFIHELLQPAGCTSICPSLGYRQTQRGECGRHLQGGCRMTSNDVGRLIITVFDGVRG